jgi:tetratricopeptide (TPR) repeat protein
MVDTYAPDMPTDGWLYAFCSAFVRHGFVVIASALELSTHWNDLRTRTRYVEVDDFDAASAAICVARYASLAGLFSLSNDDVAAIVRLASGLPLALTYTVELLAKTHATHVSAVEGDVIEGLTEQFLSHSVPVSREHIEAASVPRWIGPELLAVLVPERDSRKGIEELRRLPMVKVHPDERLTLQHQVREFVRARLKRDSPGRFAALNQRCLIFFQELSADPERSHESRQRAALELVFHSFESGTADGVTAASRIIATAMQEADMAWATAVVDEAAAHVSAPTDELWLSLWRGQVAYRRGEWAPAAIALQAAVESGLKDHPAYPLALIALGRLHYQQDADLTQAAAEYEEAIDLLEGQGQSQTRAYAMEQLAKIYRMRGELQRAIATHAASLQLAEAYLGTYALASGRGSFGTTLMLAGDLERGVAELATSIAESRHGGFREFVCTGLRSRAVGLTLQGRLAEAEAAASESLSIAEELGDGFNIAVARAALAHARLRGTHDLHEADADLVVAVEELRELRASYDLGNALVYQGALASLLADHRAARSLLDEAETLFSAHGFEYGLAVARIEISRTALAAGDPAGALAAARTAYRSACALGARFVSAAALVQALTSTSVSLGSVRGMEHLVTEFHLREPTWSANLSSLGYHDLAASVLHVSALAAAESGQDDVARDKAVAALAQAANHNAVAFVREAQMLHPTLEERGLTSSVLERWLSNCRANAEQSPGQLALERSPWVRSVDLRELWTSRPPEH